MSNWRLAAAAAAVVVLAGTAPAFADTFSGTVFYTTNVNAVPNVDRIVYSYDSTTHTFSLGVSQNIASLPGADGILFDPLGHLLIGGQTSNTVFMLDPTTGAILDTGSLPTNSYHLALDPTGNFVYTSTFQGPLEVLPLSGATIGNATQYAITGGDSGLTQVAYAPTTGNWFYVNGTGDNFGGNIGAIDMTTHVTTRLFTALDPAHSLIYDRYTGLMTMFGGGRTGTFDQNGGNLRLAQADFNCDFDQGAVDGLGHALVAGCDSITLLDYSISHDITHPDFVRIIGGFSNIDDLTLAPQPVPEPASLLLLGTGLAGGLMRRYRRKVRA